MPNAIQADILCELEIPIRIHSCWILDRSYSTNHIILKMGMKGNLIISNQYCLNYNLFKNFNIIGRIGVNSLSGGTETYVPVFRIFRSHCFDDANKQLEETNFCR